MSALSDTMSHIGYIAASIVLFNCMMITHRLCYISCDILLGISNVRHLSYENVCYLSGVRNLKVSCTGCEMFLIKLLLLLFETFKPLFASYTVAHTL